MIYLTVKKSNKEINYLHEGEAKEVLLIKHILKAIQTGYMNHTHIKYNTFQTWNTGIETYKYIL